MSGSELPVGEDDLSAWVDGRLPPSRVPIVDAYLSSRPDEAERLRADRELRRDLRERLAGKAGEPLPARLRTAGIIAERSRRRRTGLAWAAAACLWLTLGAGAGWFARGLLAPAAAPRPEAVIHEALAAHRTFVVEVVHPVEVKAAEETHLAQWLSKRLGRRLVIPDLASLGLSLVGGRLLPSGSEVAAQLMYADGRGARVTLYVRSGEDRAAPPRTLKEGDLASVGWAEAGFGYAVSGALDPDRLALVARAAHSEFGTAAPAKAPL